MARPSCLTRLAIMGIASTKSAEARGNAHVSFREVAAVPARHAAARAQEGEDGRLGMEHFPGPRAHQLLDERAVGGGKGGEGHGRERAHEDGGLLERRVEDVAEPLGRLLEGREGRELVLRALLEGVDGGAR
jgi:hypothetical protein